MGLATLYNVPTTEQEMNVFSFNNAAEHTKIADSLFRQFSLPIPQFVLDPIPLDDTGAWLFQHQSLHNIMNGVLNTPSNDLTSVDFKDPEQLSAWIWLHAQEHYKAADKLGLQ
jgi:hypothetical protein